MANARIDDLRKRLEKEPESRLFAQLAEELRKDGELEEAIRVCKEGLLRHSSYASARMTLGRALFDTGDAAAARTEFEKVLKGAPDNILASRMLGDSLEALGDLDGARARYRTTLAMAPEDKQLLAKLDALEQAAAPQPRVAAEEPQPEHLPVPEERPEAEPPPIRLVEVNEPMELERPHEAPGLRAAAAPAGPPAIEEEFELERPYDVPTVAVRPRESAPVETDLDEVPTQPGTTPDFEQGPDTRAALPEPAISAAAEMAAERPAFVEFDDDDPPETLPMGFHSPSFKEASPRERTLDMQPSLDIVEGELKETLPGDLQAPFLEEAVVLDEVEFVPEPLPDTVAGPTPPEPPAAPPLEPLASVTLADLYFKQGLPGEAISVLRQVLQREPGNARAEARLAEIQGIAAPPPAKEPLAAVSPADATRDSRRREIGLLIGRYERLLEVVRKG